MRQMCLVDRGQLGGQQEYGRVVPSNAGPGQLPSKYGTEWPSVTATTSSLQQRRLRSFPLSCQRYATSTLGRQRAILRQKSHHDTASCACTRLMRRLSRGQDCRHM